MVKLDYEKYRSKKTRVFVGYKDVVVRSRAYSKFWSTEFNNDYVEERSVYENRENRNYIKPPQKSKFYMEKERELYNLKYS